MNYDQKCMKSASRSLRIINLIIDSLCFGMITFSISYFVSYLFKDDLIFNNIIDVFGVPIAMLYYLIFEYFFSRTLGKWITGTRVVSARGTRPTFLEIVGRTVVRIIPFEGVTFLGSSGRGWHDSLSDTYVVKSRAIVTSDKHRPTDTSTGC